MPSASTDEVGAVREVPVVEKQLHAVDVRVLVEVVDALGVERRCAADYAVDLVALRKEELRKVASVLSGDAGDQCLFHIVFAATAIAMDAASTASPSASAPFVFAPVPFHSPSATPRSEEKRTQLPITMANDM